MKIKDVIGKSEIQEQRLDEFLPLALAALGGTAAGATLGDYLLAKKKGAKDWSFGQSVGRNLERGERFVTQKVAPAAEKFAKDVYKGYTGKDAPEDLEKAYDDWLDSPDLGPDPAAEKARDVDIQRTRDVDFWLDKKDESVNLKKKLKVTEADKKSDFELEVEKNFSDPYVRKAIIAKARQESGGKNIGELDWTKTSNKRLRATFPQLKSIDDSQLDKLKSQGNEAFLNYAYKDIGGYKYRGRGPIQITGKANYARIDKDLGLNGALVKDPDMLLRDPALANAASVQYLKNAGLHKKTFNDQRSAHQDVIYAIGGSLYAPGSKRGNQVLAQLEKGDIVGSTSPASVPTTAAGKTDTSVGPIPATAPRKSLIPGVPVPIDTGKPGDIVAQASAETDARRAALQRKPMGFVPPPEQKTQEPVKKDVEEPKEPKTSTIPPMASAATYNKSAEPAPDSAKGPWDKFIDTVTKGRVPPEEKERIRIPESVNTETELTDILRLAGRKK